MEVSIYERVDMNADQAKRERELDELETMLADRLPRIAGNMFKNFKDNGFNDDQAMTLTKVYVHGFSGGKYS